MTAAIKIRHRLHLLVGELIAKGWIGASAKAEIRVDARGSIAYYVWIDGGHDTAFPRSYGAAYSWEITSSEDSLDDALDKARTLTVAMRENPTQAMAPWFSTEQPTEQDAGAGAIPPAAGSGLPLADATAAGSFSHPPEASSPPAEGSGDTGRGRHSSAPAAASLSIDTQASKVTHG